MPILCVNAFRKKSDHVSDLASFENNADAFVLAPFYASGTHERILRNDKRKRLRNSDVALYFEACSCCRKVPDLTVKSAGPAKRYSPGFQDFATQDRTAFFHCEKPPGQAAGTRISVRQFRICSLTDQKLTLRKKENSQRILARRANDRD